MWIAVGAACQGYIALATAVGLLNDGWIGGPASGERIVRADIEYKFKVRGKVEGKLRGVFAAGGSASIGSE